MSVRSALGWAALFSAAIASAPEAQVAEAKFIRFTEEGRAETRIMGGINLPQVGSDVPDGPKRVRARVSDRTLEEYAQASLLALRVYEAYGERVRQAKDRNEAQLVASSANGELARVLDRSGVMDHVSFLRMTDALNADEALAIRARQIAARVLASEGGLLQRSVSAGG